MVSIGVFCYTADASASLCDQVDRQLFLLIYCYILGLTSSSTKPQA